MVKYMLFIHPSVYVVYVIATVTGMGMLLDKR